MANGQSGVMNSPCSGIKDCCTKTVFFLNVRTLEHLMNYIKAYLYVRLTPLKIFLSLFQPFLKTKCAYIIWTCETIGTAIRWINLLTLHFAYIE